MTLDNDGGAASSHEDKSKHEPTQQLATHHFQNCITHHFAVYNVSQYYQHVTHSPPHCFMHDKEDAHELFELFRTPTDVDNTVQHLIDDRRIQLERN